MHLAAPFDGEALSCDCEAREKLRWLGLRIFDKLGDFPIVLFHQ